MLHKQHGISNHWQFNCQELVQANNKENIKAPHYWPFVRGIYNSSVDSPHKGPVIISIQWCHHELHNNKMWPPNPDLHTWSVLEAIWVTLVNVPPSWTCHHHNLDKVMPSSEVNQQKALNLVPPISLITIYNVVWSVKMYLTLWGRDKWTPFTTFSNGFSRMKMFEFRLKFHWRLFLRFQLTIFQHWFRYWLDAVQATSHYLNQWWLVYWRIYASLGLNELTLRSAETSCNIHWSFYIFWWAKLYSKSLVKEGELFRNLV